MPDKSGIGTVLLQFLLVTVVGGILTFFFQVLRDRASRHEAVQAAKRELIKQVDELYRSSKQVKRMIRSRLREEGDAKLVNSQFFQSRMDELSKIQLSLEQIRQLVRARVDLFPQDRRRRIIQEIGYAESFFESVVKNLRTVVFLCPTPSAKFLTVLCLRIFLS